MTYQPFAIKYRPKNFSEVIGHELIVNALRFSIANKKIHNCYMLSGTRGIGKTSLARIIAKAINCESSVSGDPCNSCKSCLEINQSRHPDVYEIDAASRTKVEETKELLDSIVYLPQHSKYKIYIIDEVHMLSMHSFNALLKTLEEPPAHVKFILATTDLHKVPTTVISRCMLFLLPEIEKNDLLSLFKYVLTHENIPYSDEVVDRIAATSPKSFREALNNLELAIYSNDGNLSQNSNFLSIKLTETKEVLKLIQAIHDNQKSQILNITKLFIKDAIKSETFLQDILSLLHQGIVGLSLPRKDFQYSDFFNNLSLSFLINTYKALIQLENDLSFVSNKWDLIQVTLIQLSESKNVVKTTYAPISVSKDTISDAPVSEPSAVNPENWHHWVKKINVEGMLKEVVYNSMITKCNENEMTINLMPAHSILLNDNLKKHLADKIGNTLNIPSTCKIEFTFDNKNPNANVPAKIFKQQHETKKKLAEEQLLNNPIVKSIEENFQAKIKTIEYHVEEE